ncbi:MAG TPA: DUF5302 domain-containing protein [Actinomycetes bacterium]|nr:DUF5302 domain-containing protein [Actinomycetes bacterium]
MSSESTDPDAPNGPDELREKFREALARKQGRGGEAGSSGRTGPARAPHTAPAKPQRSFRRKSG